MGGKLAHVREALEHVESKDLPDFFDMADFLMLPEGVCGMLKDELLFGLD